MARKSSKRVTGFVLFDVHYVDGTRSSNRKVPAEALDSLDGDDPALAIIEEQDRVIGERSGTPRPSIKSIERSG